MAIQYNCSLENIFGRDTAQTQSGHLVSRCRGAGYRGCVTDTGTLDVRTLGNGDVRTFIENLGYTDFDTSNYRFWFKTKYITDNETGEPKFVDYWPSAWENGYGDIGWGTGSWNFTTVSTTNDTPVVDLFLHPLLEIRIDFNAVAPGNTVVSPQQHLITIESEEDIRLRTYLDLSNFWHALGFNQTIDTINYNNTPTILCDEFDSDTGTTSTSTTVFFSEGFTTSTTTHTTTGGGSGASGGETLPEVAEQVEENEGDIFILNNEVDELQAGIYQLRRDNQDQDAYWEEVYVRVRDFSGRVRDEVQDLRDHVDAQPAFWNTTINAINRNVRAAQDAAANAENAAFGLTGQLQALQARIEALENQ